MAKKKVTKKTARSTSRRPAAKAGAKKASSSRKPATRKKTAKKTAAKKKVTKKKTAKKTTTKKVTKKKTVARKAATTKKKTAKKPVTKKTPAKKAPARKTPAKKSKTKKTATNRKRGRDGSPAGAAPDRDGYVVINGRRVRIMSTAVELPVRKKSAARSRPVDETPIENVATKPAKTHLSRKELDEFRTLLLQKRRELIGDLSSMEEQALQASGGNLSHMPIHMADIGTDTYDQDFMLGLAETERRGLREIDDALVRIQQKTYGICQMTGKPIPLARLRAKPWAKYTIEAAREMERGLAE